MALARLFDIIIEEDIESIAKLEKKSSEITTKVNSINYAFKKIDDEILLIEEQTKPRPAMQE